MNGAPCANGSTMLASAVNLGRHPCELAVNLGQPVAMKYRALNGSIYPSALLVWLSVLRGPRGAGPYGAVLHCLWSPPGCR